jgi:pyruvate dehydrogenase E2 component (dihydrolipoamide acetyltransferase)
MGYDMREGTVVRWRKQEGEPISRGEIIAEIETDKATVEMEAFSSGVLGRIVAEEGRTVPVGELIAIITEPGEAVPAVEDMTGGRAATTTPSQAAQPPPAPQQTSPAAAPSPAVSGEVRASPIARRLAVEKGIDLAQVAGTGPGGRITESDVLAYEESLKTAPAAASDGRGDLTAAPPGDVRASPIARRLGREKGIDLAQVTGTGPGGRITESDVLAYEERIEAAATPPDGRVELTRMRRAIARVTTQSKREAPHFYVTSEIDMTEAMALRRQLNEALQDGTRVSVNDMIVKAVARVLEKYPNFNASFQEDYLRLNPDLNIGIAIALEEGLIVPAIPGCQNKSLAEIARASSDLRERAGGGTLRAEEYTGATFSVSNLGMFDVDSFAAIIFPPNAAVLAVGSVKEQPVVRDGQIAIAQIMKATISVDHRVADGAEGAQFLMEVKQYLERPVSLLL